MNGRKELLAQCGVYAALVVALHFLGPRLTSEHWSIPVTLFISALPILAYNLVASVCWWTIQIRGKRKNVIKYPACRVMLIGLIAVLVVIGGVRGWESAENRREEAFVARIFGPDRHLSGIDYSILRSEKITDEVLLSSVARIRTSGDSFLIDLEGGVSLIAVVNHRARIIVLEGL